MNDSGGALVLGVLREDVAGDYGQAFSARGITMVALNDAGEIVEYWPDGTSSVVNADK
jgi:hypothetical protein